MIIGMTAPPRGTEGDKKLVITWSVVFCIVIAWCVLLVYLMLHVF
jgi:hypothetical protein